MSDVWLAFNWTVFWADNVRACLPFSPTNFLTPQLRGSFASLLLLQVDQQTIMAAKRMFHPSTLNFCLSFCAQGGKQPPAPPHRASFVRDSMLSGGIKHDPDTPRDQPHQGTWAEHRCVQTSVSLAWRQVPAPRIVKLLWQWGNFRELCDPKLRS